MVGWGLWCLAFTFLACGKTKMNILTYAQHLAVSGIAAYFFANQIRDPATRPNFLTTLLLSENATALFLQGLSQRAAAEGNTWLAEKLAIHVADEHRHIQILAHALKQLGTQVSIPKSLAEASATKQPYEPVFEAYYQGISLEHMPWNTFFASSYIIELDGSNDFARMANVLPEDEPISRNLKKGLLSIAKDEKSHAAYLYEAMMRRMPAADVQKLVDEWQTRKVKAILSMVNGLLAS